LIWDGECPTTCAFVSTQPRAASTTKPAPSKEPRWSSTKGEVIWVWIRTVYERASRKTRSAGSLENVLGREAAPFWVAPVPFVPFPVGFPTATLVPAELWAAWRLNDGAATRLDRRSNRHTAACLGRMPVVMKLLRVRVETGVGVA